MSVIFPPNPMTIPKDYWLSEPPFRPDQRLVVGIAICFCLLGIVMNFLMVLNLYRSSMMRQYIFNINMSIADSIVCLIKLYIHSIEFYLNRHWGGPVQCQFQGFISQSCWAVSIVSMTCITIDPFRIVVLKQGPLSKTHVRVILSILWIGVGILPATVPFWPVGSLTAPYEYHSSGLYSVFCYTCNQTFLIAVVSLLDAFVLFINPINIYLIFRYISSRIAKLLIKNSSFSQRAVHLQQTVIKRGIVLTTTHFFSWWITVLTIVYEFSTGQWLPEWADRLNYMMPMVSLSLNPLVCFYLEPRIRYCFLDRPMNLSIELCESRRQQRAGITH
jgi:hypothetical protein